MCFETTLLPPLIPEIILAHVSRFAAFPVNLSPYFCLHNVIFCVNNLFLALAQTRDVEPEPVYANHDALVENFDAQ